FRGARFVLECGEPVLADCTLRRAADSMVSDMLSAQRFGCRVALGNGLGRADAGCGEQRGKRITEDEDAARPAHERTCIALGNYIVAQFGNGGSAVPRVS